MKSVKGIKTRKKRKRNWSRIIGISLFVAVMGTLITLSALYRSPQIPPEPADKYFRFSEAFAEVTSDSTEYMIFVKTVTFNITSVGGNATKVQIRPLGASVSDDALDEQLYFPEIILGESKEIGRLEYTYPVQTTKEEGKGWPLNFRVTCPQAMGNVTVYITQKFVY